MTRVVLSWSGGKDCTLALRELRRAGDLQVAGVMTTVTTDYDRISMHGVRRSLLVEQARALGLPLHVVEMSAGAGNEEYAARTGEALESLRADGVHTLAYGDIFLEDVRAYREEMLAGHGMHALFPLWGLDTAALARDFIGSGFRAVATCVDTEAIPAEFAGREYDESFLRELPPGADPCGENGEFHTFVFDGPGFSAPIRYALGRRTLRDDRFMYRDLAPLPSI